MMREVLGGFGAAAVLVFGFACGGNVVVDPEDSTGSGGFGSTTTTTSDGQGGAGAGCGFPPPVGEVYNCGGSATSGTGGPLECMTFYCDGGGNTYAASCTSGACACQHNGATICTCAVSGSGDICAGTAEPCCPFPIAQ